MKKIFEKLIKNQIKRKPFPLISTGQSMLPLLYPDDKIYLKKTSFAKIKTNDVVAFKKNNNFICHRVIYKGKNYLITKGDNSRKIDGKIKSKNILGKIEEVKRGGKAINLDFLYLIQSTHYFEEIVKIKKKLEAAKVNFVFLKGLPLHLYYEGRYPRRLYADCDVLIEKKDFKKAEKILLSFGYQKMDLHWSKKVKEIQKDEMEATFWRRLNNFSITFDVHLQIADLSIVHLGHFDNLYSQEMINKLTKEFLGNKKRVIVNNQQFPILSSSNLVLYLALHFFHHNFQGAFRLEFLSTVSKKEGKNKEIWQKLAIIINQFNLNNFVYSAFILAKKYYDLNLPPWFLGKIKPKENWTFKLLKLADWLSIYHHYPSVNPKKINIFEEAPRIKAGISRFLNLFLLSPSPFFKKFLVVFRKEVWYSIFFVVKNKIKNYSTKPLSNLTG